MRYLIILLGVGGLAYWFLGGSSDNAAQAPGTPAASIVSIQLPDALSANAELGKSAFEAKCSICHGQNAAGQDGVAPPLVHKIYESSHHGDESFQRAVEVGVRQHHWPFGSMPVVEGLTRGDIAMIVAYVRELQRANGIN